MEQHCTEILKSKYMNTTLLAKKLAVDGNCFTPFLFSLESNGVCKKNTGESHKVIVDVYGDHALSEATCKKRLRRKTTKKVWRLPNEFEMSIIQKQFKDYHCILKDVLIEEVCMLTKLLDCTLETMKNILLQYIQWHWVIINFYFFV